MLVLALAFPVGAIAGVGSGSDEDVLYVSIEKTDNSYCIYVRNAVAITTVELGIYKPSGTYIIEPKGGFKDNNDGYGNDLLMYQAGIGVGFTSLGRVAIGEFTFDDNVIPKLGYVGATGIRDGNSVRVDAVIEGGAMDVGDFQAVSNILSVPTGADLGVPLILSGIAVPMYSTYRTIQWSVKDAGGTGAYIADGKLYTTGLGTVGVTATIANGIGLGIPYSKDFDITVKFTPVIHIGQVTNAAWAGFPLLLAGEVYPANATYQDIVWSLSDPGTTGATLVNDVFYASLPGTAVVTATIVNGSAVGTDFVFNISILVEALFVPVSDITGIPEAVTAGEPHALNGVVAPEYATKKDIAWSVVSSGTTGATITGNVLYTDSPGEATVRATIANGLEENGASYVREFTIKVNAPRCGDVDGNGRVAPMDASLLSRYLADWPGIAINMVAADVDGDGEVTLLDLAILHRHIAGWPGYETLPYQP
ncbi:MAG: dockerin type I domain-containing protein [Clostridiales bacterium]|nr:dockerin type I domain-containing protein [Clostridiales bacterium]